MSPQERALYLPDPSFPRDTESDPRWGWFWVWDRDQAFLLLVSDIPQFSEFPTNLALAADVDPNAKILKWWKNHSDP